jgi:hypothetical protein
VPGGERLTDAGITVIAAAGNNGKSTEGKKDLWPDSLAR